MALVGNQVLCTDGEFYYLGSTDDGFLVVRYSEEESEELNCTLQIMAKFDPYLEEVPYAEAPNWVKKAVEKSNSGK